MTLPVPLSERVNIWLKIVKKIKFNMYSRPIRLFSGMSIKDILIIEALITKIFDQLNETKNKKKNVF